MPYKVTLSTKSQPLQNQMVKNPGTKLQPLSQNLQSLASMLKLQNLGTSNKPFLSSSQISQVLKNLAGTKLQPLASNNNGTQTKYQKLANLNLTPPEAGQPLDSFSVPVNKHSTKKER